MAAQGQTNGMADMAGVGAVGLMDVLRGMLRRRKKLIALFTLGFMALGALLLAVSSPIYTASSRILIEYEDTPYTRAGAASGAATATPQITERDVRSQVEVIRSRDLALKVLHRLKLVGTPEFDRLKRGLGPLRRLKIALGFAPDPRKQTPEQRAIEEWYKRLKVYSLPRTKVVVIEFGAASPRTAAAVANALADAYIEQTRTTRLERTGEAREWLKQQIEKLRAKVVQAEKAVESYRAKAGLFQGVQTKLHNQELSELSAQIVRAAAERSQAEAKAKAIRRLLAKGQVEKSADVLRSPLIQRLREQQVQIRRRLAELSTVYLDNHPRVKAVRKELADLKRQINAEARKIAESLEEQARIAAAREAELRARLAKMKAQVSVASQDEVKLRELEREAKAQRSLLESFLARYTEALTRRDKQAQPGMARIIARAYAPAAPSYPRPGPMMLLLTLAGLVLGLGLAFILEVMAAVRQGEERMAQAPASVSVAAEGAAGRERVVAAAVEEPVAAPRSREDERGHDAEPVVSGQPAASGKAAESQKTAMPEKARAGAAATTGAATTTVATATTAATATAATAATATLASTRDMEKVRQEAGKHMVAEAAATNPLERMANAAAARIRQWHEDANVQRIALASIGMAAEDAAETVMEAARRLAGQGRVILLDAAAEGHRLPLGAKAAGGEQGLAQLLAGRAGFADVARMDVLVPALHVIAAGEGALSGKLLHGEVMQQLLRALSENYDLVLLHEGEARYPLHASESVLPLAEAALVLHEDDAQGLATGLRDAISGINGMRVALLSPAAASGAAGQQDVAASARQKARADGLNPATSG